MTYEIYEERLSDRLGIDHLRGATATTTDALLLAAFLPCCEGAALELGAGAGTVSLLAAVRGRFARAELCERVPPLAELCRRNIEKNRLTDRLSVIEADLRTLTPPARYLSVYANPPYRRVGEGRPAADPLLDTARFERAGTVLDFCETAARLLLPEGSLSLVFPQKRREELLRALGKVGLHPREEVTVYPYPGGVPKLLLLRAAPRPGGLTVRRFTLAREAGGAPTEAAEALYRDGILPTEGEPI